MSGPSQGSALPDEQTKRFEQLGEERVRWLAPQWQQGLQEQAWAWLAARKQDADQQQQAFQIEQADMARRTLRWAIIAGVVACLSVVISLGAWLFPRG